MNPTYWLNLFSYKTWTEFLAAGGTVTGFRDGRWSVSQRMARSIESDAIDC